MSPPISVCTSATSPLPVVTAALRSTDPRTRKAALITLARADSLASYGPVLKVIATLARSEKSWSLVGEPYPGR